MHQLRDHDPRSGEHHFKTDLGRLIQLFGDHLYAEADVFVRELVQNAHDSVRRRGDGIAGEIRITADRGAGTIVFTDNGLGMNETDVRNYLATIGGSGTHASRMDMLEDNPNEARRLIGQFGIGMLSAFIVAKEVVVETRRESESAGLRWTADGGPRYRLETIDRPEVGTTVRLLLKDKYLGMSRLDDLVEAVRRYCDFMPYPIYVNSIRANSIHAPWHRGYDSEKERKKAFEEWVGERFGDVPLEVIPVALQEPRVEGVLYITDGRVPEVNTSGVVDVYQSRMFVRKGDPNLLPEWARFVGGVVDGQDLSLTASRDAIRKDDQHKKTREALGRLIVDHLCSMAVEQPSRLRLILRWHHYLVKGMALKHDDFFEAIADRVPFEVNSGRSDDQEPELITLPEYLERQQLVDPQGRKMVYYISEPEDALQIRNMCDANGLLVINAGLVFDEVFLKRYAEPRGDGIALECVDAADSSTLFRQLGEFERTHYLELEHRLGALLGEAFPDQDVVVRTERFLPDHLPAILTHWRDAETRRRLKALAEHPAFSESYTSLFASALGMQIDHGQSLVLHLNAGCDLIRRLKAQSFENPMIQTTWQLICHNALLYGPRALDGNQVRRLQSLSNEALYYMITLAEHLGQIEQHKTDRRTDSGDK